MQFKSNSIPLTYNQYRLIPGFAVEYEPDFRQKIADAWPKSIDDSDTSEWGWSYDISVHELAKKILDGIHPQYKAGLKLA